MSHVLCLDVAAMIVSLDVLCLDVKPFQSAMEYAPISPDVDCFGKG